MNWDVADKIGLLEALRNAVIGDVIYVNDTATIDLTGEISIPIPPGITLTSNGGLIHVDEAIRGPQLFFLTNPNVHITGLKLRGPAAYFEPDYDQTKLPERVRISNPSYLGTRCIGSRAPFEIDNCEIWNWSYSAIFLSYQKDLRSHIHHNYIHDCSGTIGYGVEVFDANPLIDYNIFDRCRHVVAGTGQEGCSYEAAYNEIRSGACEGTLCAQSFDMHAPGEYTIFKFCAQAGSWIDIHHNIVPWSAGPAVVIRGKPRWGASIHDNWFYHDKIGGFNTAGACIQINAKGRFHAFNNFITPDKILAPEIHYT